LILSRLRNLQENTLISVNVQLQEIFANIGVEMDCASFDKLYEVASQQSPHGEVSVESFRGVLDQAQEVAFLKYGNTFKLGVTGAKTTTLRLTN
jgi:hypothetical protein